VRTGTRERMAAAAARARGPCLLAAPAGRARLWTGWKRREHGRRRAASARGAARRGSDPDLWCAVRLPWPRALLPRARRHGGGACKRCKPESRLLAVLVFYVLHFYVS
jgi:hypothetical protein